MTDCIEVYRTRKGYVEFDPLEDLYRVFVRRPGARSQFLCVMEMRNRCVAIAYLQDYHRDQPEPSERPAPPAARIG